MTSSADNVLTATRQTLSKRSAQIQMDIDRKTQELRHLVALQANISVLLLLCPLNEESEDEDNTKENQLSQDSHHHSDKTVGAS